MDTQPIKVDLKPVAKKILTVTQDIDLDALIQERQFLVEGYDQFKAALQANLEHQMALRYPHIENRLSQIDDIIKQAQAQGQMIDIDVAALPVRTIVKDTNHFGIITK